MKYFSEIATLFFFALLIKILIWGGSTIEGLSFFILATHLTVQQYFSENKKIVQLEKEVSNVYAEIKKVEDRLDKTKAVVDGYQMLRGGRG